MSELKRPERYIHFESIKPELKDVTEFYTRKVTDYQYRLKQLNEYADALENEISVLKENSKIEILLDNTDKQLVVVPKIFDKWIKDFDGIDDVSYWYILDRFVKANRHLENDFFGLGDLEKYPQGWDRALMSALINGYTVEKEKKYILKHIDLSEQYKNESFYLSHSRYAKLKHESFSKDFDVSEIERCHFTQSEIDKLNIGSYEQIEVKLEE